MNRANETRLEDAAMITTPIAAFATASLVGAPWPAGIAAVARAVVCAAAVVLAWIKGRGEPLRASPEATTDAGGDAVSPMSDGSGDGGVGASRS